MDKLRIPLEPTAVNAPDTIVHTDSPSPAQGHTEQRRYPRIRCFLAVQLRPADDQNLLLGKLSNVSLGGCGVESAGPVKTGTPVALSPLAADGALWVQGVVVNTRLMEGAASYHIGVRFLDGEAPMPAHNVKEFVRFVEEAAAKQELQDSYLGRLTRGKA